MSGTSCSDAAENMENASVSVEKDPTTANPPSKKLRLADGNTDATSSPTIHPCPGAAENAAADEEEPRGELINEALFKEDPTESASGAASSAKTMDSKEEKGKTDKESPSNDGPVSSSPPLDGTATAAATAEDESTEVEDSAVLHQQLKDGDRIQVLWTIESNIGSSNRDAGTDDVNNDYEQERAGAGPVLSTERWWGASLLPWDGSAEQGVAIRTLRYDAFPPDFPHETDETVVFAETKNRLVTYPGLEPMIFRREGGAAGSASSPGSTATAAQNEDDSSVVVTGGREGMEQLVDGMLMGALQKNGALWGALSAARQAEIAEAIAHKKARLLELMEEHLDSHDVIDVADMQAILARTMAPS